MPQNPNRQWHGGDVDGQTPIDVTMGDAIKVASASFDPGYSLDTTLKAGYADKADLVRGYGDSGEIIGE